MLAAAFTTIALLPGLLDPTVANLKPQTPLPILLPSSMWSDTKTLYPTAGGSEKEWSISLASAKNCGGANACFVADFVAEQGGTPIGARKATLIRGIKGRFKPLSCGASCSPPSISFKTGGVTYTFQATVGTQKTERARLITMANDAIRKGPR
jgi:hypothetical protein